MNQNNLKFTKDEAQRILLKVDSNTASAFAYRTLDYFLTSIEVNGNDGGSLYSLLGWRQKRSL